jgi:hypothetical protein
MSFTVLPVSDCVSTPFALRPQHGTPGPPLSVICVKLMMMSRMNSMLFFTAHTLTQCLFAGGMSPYSQRQEHGMFLLVYTRTTTDSIFFLHELIVFYEQASCRTLWLKAFSCKPCKPCILFNMLDMPVLLDHYVLVLIVLVINWQNVSILRGSMEKILKRPFTM